MRESRGRRSSWRDGGYDSRWSAAGAAIQHADRDVVDPRLAHAGEREGHREWFLSCIGRHDTVEHQPPPCGRHAHAFREGRTADRVEDEQPVHAPLDRPRHPHAGLDLEQSAGRSANRRRGDPYRWRLDNHGSIRGRDRFGFHRQAALADSGLGAVDLHGRAKGLLFEGKMPPTSTGEILDALHAAADEQLRRGCGGRKRIDEPPVLRERGVGCGERTGHHRTGRQHATFPRQPLHLSSDGCGAPQTLDRHGGIGDRRFGLPHILLGLGKHRRHWQVAQCRGW